MNIAFMSLILTKGIILVEGREGIDDSFSSLSSKACEPQSRITLANWCCFGLYKSLIFADGRWQNLTTIVGVRSFGREKFCLRFMILGALATVNTADNRTLNFKSLLCLSHVVRMVENSPYWKVFDSVWQTSIPLESSIRELPGASNRRRTAKRSRKWPQLQSLVFNDYYHIHFSGLRRVF